jgi:hypothetical protein
MKPFHKRSSPLTAPQKAAKSADVIANSNSAETAAPTAIVQEKFPAISMSADLKSMLDQPLDPRVDRILQKINDGKIADERSAKGPRVIHPPRGDEQSRQGDEVARPLADKL